MIGQKKYIQTIKTFLNGTERGASKRMKHKYSHLGEAPYSLVGYFYDAPVQDINGAWHGGSHTCSHCGQPINHVFECRSSDGKTFFLGSVHVQYLGDEGLTKAVKSKMNEVQREAKREARRIKAREEWEAGQAERDAAFAKQKAEDEARKNHLKSEYKRISPILSSKPHPNTYFSRKGKTMLDYVNYFLGQAPFQHWDNSKFQSILIDFGAKL